MYQSWYLPSSPRPIISSRPSNPLNTLFVRLSFGFCWPLRAIINCLLTYLFIVSSPLSFSVVIHTLDRFWKIVFPIHHRKHYRRWMLFIGLFLPWLNGFASNIIPTAVTTRITDGICYPRTFWPTKYSEEVCSSWFVACLSYQIFVII